MRRILAGSSLLAALLLAAPARAAEAPAGRGAAPVATSALLALVPDRATIAQATQISPTAPVFITATAVGSGSISPAGQILVDQGTDRTFTMTPLSCAVVGNVRVDGSDLGPLTTYTFHSVSSNHTIEASFVPAPPDTIVASAGPGGTISPPGAVAYECGASADYVITPDACHVIRDVIVDGRSSGAVAIIRFFDLRANHTIRATFVEGTQYTITASSGVGGTISPIGAVKVNCGSNQLFTISPGACFQVAGVAVDGVSQGPVLQYTFTDVRAPHSISASFVPSTAPDTITASAGPGGTIEPAGVVVSACGTSKTFTMRHDDCYRVADVVVDGVSKGPVSSFTFANGGHHTITASFASAPQYAITAAAGPGGTISPAGSVQVNCGASQTFTMTPDSGYSVVSVVVDGILQGQSPSYTFTNVVDDHVISVLFRSGFDLEVLSLGCPGARVRPLLFGSGFFPNTTYSFDVQPLDCVPPAPGTALAHVGSMHTDETGAIAATSAPCFDRRLYSVIVDVVGNSVFIPSLDPVACFTPSSPTPTAGIQDLSGEVTPEGAMLSWWVMDLAAYRGFVVHRAPEGGEEEVVTPAPLAPPASHPPAQVRWRDGAATPGSRYAYRIEALKSAGSDWYGPVMLTIPAAPAQLALRSATPNPFSGTTRLALDLPADGGELRLDVFDVAGRHVRTLRPGPLSPGRDVVDWDGLDDHGAPARGGLYVVRVQGARGKSVMRIMKLE